MFYKKKLKMFAEGLSMENIPLLMSLSPIQLFKLGATYYSRVEALTVIPMQSTCKWEIRNHPVNKCDYYFCECEDEIFYRLDSIGYTYCPRCGGTIKWEKKEE